MSILALGSISPAYSVTLTLDSASAEWTSVTAGTAVMGLNTEEVRWGVPFPGGLPGVQSGFRFDVSATPAAVFTGTPFALGEFTHFNHPVFIPTASGATLELDLEITNGNTQMKTFTFDFLIDETPNVALTNCDPAKQVSNVACDDIITFLNSMSSTIVTIDGVNYQLELLGFGPTANNVQTMFTTVENMDNMVTLWAILSSSTVIGGEIIPIETTSLILAGAQSFSWMIPVLLSGIGIGLFVVSRKSE